VATIFRLTNTGLKIQLKCILNRTIAVHLGAQIETVIAERHIDPKSLHANNAANHFPGSAVKAFWLI
jgi:hypothetical protein